MVQLFLDHGARLGEADSRGNTCAHMAILHGHFDIFTLLEGAAVKRQAESAAAAAAAAQQATTPVEKSRQEQRGSEAVEATVSAAAAMAVPLLEARNKDGFTCLELAAAAGDAATFGFILDKSRKQNWT